MQHKQGVLLIQEKDQNAKLYPCYNFSYKVVYEYAPGSQRNKIFKKQMYCYKGETMSNYLNIISYLLISFSRIKMRQELYNKLIVLERN